MTELVDKWLHADFASIGSATWPEELKEYDQWMTHKSGEKMPYAPWTNPDAPAPCSECNTTADECEHSARFKWGWEGNRRPYKDAMMSTTDRNIAGPVFIQLEDDPFVFVDGDDVRCPESGEVHPAFTAVLEHLGMTYADVSVSGAGVHAYYLGALPGDETVAEWDIDDEPWGENDDLPAIEIYSGKHNCLTTGKRIPGTPTTVEPWNGAVVRKLLEANGEFAETVEVSPSDKNDRKREDSPTDAEAPEDCIRAVNRLDAARVAEKTIVSEWTDGSGAGRGFLPVWGSSTDGGTANFVDDFCWVDTGQNGGRGGPVEMALIDLGELRNTNSEVGKATGADFWTGYEHLRDLGFSLPESPHSTDESESTDYYDIDLGAYHDGDVWSDPDSMLSACLKARSEGAVDRDVDPPALAMAAIVEGLLSTDVVGEETKEMAKEIYHNELSAADIGKGGKVVF